MKKITLFLLLLTFIFSGYSNPIDSVLAKKIANNFYYQNSETKSISDISTKLVFISKVNDSLKSNNPIALYYVFNINKDDGFVIVAADNDVDPILGYSLKGEYSLTNQPPAFIDWMKGYEKQILYVKRHSLKADDRIVAEWNNYIYNNSLKIKKGKGGVSPLVKTTWDQGPYYNDICPYILIGHVHTLTGCVATAMAQIMKYWKYPKQGTGFNSYDCPFYGTQSVNFANTTFDWANMPDSLYAVSNQNQVNAVATLMYDCGVSVNMNYGLTGSNAYVIAADSIKHQSYYPHACAENAYKTYFGYDSKTIQGIERINYAYTDWINVLKNELDNIRPIQYRGAGINGGHTWICDGYDSNNKFHMNWGWGGSNDAFYELNVLNTALHGNDNGDYSYSNSQQAIIGIQPLSSNYNTNLELYSDITVTPNPIEFQQSFTVNVNIYNAGNTNFIGDYCAALFDETGTFIDYVQILTTGSNPLPPNNYYQGGIDFNTNGLSAAPGNYTIGIYYKSTEGNWIFMNQGNYNNPISISINSSSNNITLYSNITPTPSTFVQGQSASVSANFVNNGTNTFYGDYAAVLSDLSGNLVQIIQVLAETNGLPSGYAYKSPITFSTSSITAPPGTYLLALEDSVFNIKHWYYVGGTTSYSNPIKINVVAPALNADIYEPNNSQATAYTLPLNWSSNASNPKTTGSNLHIGSDIDYYKINLAPGYNYTITARAHDSGNSGNGNTYTADVIWSYNTGSGWSDTYDDVMTGNILLNGAGTITFVVGPYFEGITGTYLLDIKISRTIVSSISDIISINDKIFINPNPASDFINIESKDKNYNNLEIKLFNTVGELVKCKILSPVDSKIYVKDLNNGMYILSIKSKEYFINKKIIIKH